MTSIAIFCDGTWNNKDRTDHDTSVARIFQALEAEVAAGRTDVKPYYIEGLGTDNDARSIGKFIDKWRGGALGRGLTRNIREGYKYLCDNYKAGDKIYIFGFSRGAYTARSLAGMVRASGLVSKESDINKAMHRYRDPDEKTRPSTDDSNAFRAEKSPKFYTTDAELEWRRSNGKTLGDPIEIAYLGVFDTVGTAGIPGVLSQLGLIPEGHGFHDLELSSMVKAGRHAIGLDENRRLYKHTGWSNVSELNDKTTRDANGGARYRQEWFPGDHGIIGGSGPNRQISNTVMGWIVEGAEVAGLSVKIPESLKPTVHDFRGPLTNLSNKKGWFWRDGPGRTAIGDIHSLALQRVNGVPGYHPKSLKLLDIAGWQALINEEINNRFV